MNRKFGASIAALALAGGLVACGDNGEDVTEVEATETNIETETNTVENSEAADASESEGADAEAEDAEGETVEVTQQDGSKVLVPAEAIEAGKEYGLDNWGDPINVETNDGKTLIEYDADKNIVYSKETGALPIVGAISKVWKENGGLDAEIGLPTAAEEKRPDNNGWIQSFQNGDIEWLEEAGQYTDKITMK